MGSELRGASTVTARMGIKREPFLGGTEKTQRGFCGESQSGSRLKGKPDFNSVEADYFTGSHSAGALATRSFSIL